MKTIALCVGLSVIPYAITVAFVGQFSWASFGTYLAVGLVAGLAIGLIIGQATGKSDDSYDTHVMDLVDVQETKYRDKQGNHILHVFYRDAKNHKKFFLVTLGTFTVSEFMGRYDRGVLIPNTKAVFIQGDSFIEVKTAKPNGWAILPNVENVYTISQPKAAAAKEIAVFSPVEELVLA